MRIIMTNCFHLEEEVHENIKTVSSILLQAEVCVGDVDVSYAKIQINYIWTYFSSSK